MWLTGLFLCLLALAVILALWVLGARLRLRAHRQDVSISGHALHEPITAWTEAVLAWSGDVRFGQGTAQEPGLSDALMALPTACDDVHASLLACGSPPFGVKVTGDLASALKRLADAQAAMDTHLAAQARFTGHRTLVRGLVGHAQAVERACNDLDQHIRVYNHCRTQTPTSLVARLLGWPLAHALHVDVSSALAPVNHGTARGITMGSMGRTVQR